MHGSIETAAAAAAKDKAPPLETSPDGPDSSFNSQNYPSISTPKVEVLALVSHSRTAFQFQHAKRPPARGQRAIAFSSFQRGSVLRQLVEQAGLPRPQRPGKIAPEMRCHAAAKRRRSLCGGSS